MLFPTFTFAVFFLVVYTGHVALRTRTRLWKLGLVCASAVFYGWWDWRFLGLLSGSILINWALASRLHQVGTAGDSAGGGSDAESRQRRRILHVAVVLNLGVLGFFKYYDFFALSAIDMLGLNPASETIPLFDIVLPVGISFFTFQALSYVIDVSRGKVPPASLLDVAVYLSFFPQLVAGPIVRATEFLPQLAPRDQHENVLATEALWLIGRGLFKKVVISTYLAQAIVDPVFAGPSSASREELWIGMYAYAIQIYADFSGYADIAIGLALLLGFRFPQNFDNPYRSQSIQEFWQRWHQTLSRWLRDYLYIPLGGNRRGTVLTYRNLMLTMLLGGLWHGAAWTFVVWGAIHGLTLSVERFLGNSARDSAPKRPTPSGAVLAQSPSSATIQAVSSQGDPSAIDRRKGRLTLAPKPILKPFARWFVTFHIVCIAWILFRASSIGDASDYITGLLTASSGGPISLSVLGIIVAAVVFQFAPSSIAGRARLQLSRLHPVTQGALLGLWIALVVALGPQGVSPFIYFQF